MKNELFKKILLGLGICIVLCFTIIEINFNVGNKPKQKPQPCPQPKPEIPELVRTNNFNIDLIKTTRRDSNYLISPYSIEVALNMLREGADNNTKAEIDKLVPSRTINDVSIKNRIKIANSLFINNDYKNKVKKSFINTLVDNYDAEVLYDSFNTPDAINNWVDKHTDGMIKKLSDNISPSTVNVLINAIAVDVEWASPFECDRTTSAEFTKKDNKKINVEMMHNSFESSSYEYLKTEDATGVIIPYKAYNSKTGEEDYSSDSRLEFVGILPNDDVKTYIENLTEEKLNNLFNSSKRGSSNFEIVVSLPRFKYSYEIPNFKEVLISLGVEDAFNINNADFTKILDKADMKDNLYVSEAIHKTYIDLNEKGTKAAAVTGFMMKDTAAIQPEEKEQVFVKFDKPFIYMIRDSKSKEILFFGVTYEPNEWKGSTCSKN